MKIKPDGYFPWPVLQDDREDYKCGIYFNTSIDTSKSTKELLIINYKWDLNSSFISNLISSHQAKVIMHIDSKSFRKTFEINKMQSSVEIDKKSFSEGFDIEVTILVVTSKTVTTSFDNDFDDDFKIVNEFTIPNAGIIAVGESVVISVDFYDSGLKNLFSVTRKDDQTFPYKIELKDRIVIVANKSTFDSYIQLKQHEQFLGTMFVKIALNYAIMELLTNHSITEENGKTWSKTILRKLSEFPNFDIDTVRAMVAPSNAISMDQLQQVALEYTNKILDGFFKNAIRKSKERLVQNNE